MKRGLITSMILCLVLLCTTELAAQYYRNQGYWKKDRWSVSGGIGASNFLGELGGRDQIGSDFIWDLETQYFRPAISLGVRYVTSRNTALRIQGSYAVLGGDDALTEEMFRSNRNIHFRSRSIEASALLEVTLRRVRPGHRYNLTGAKGQKPRAAELYVFGGLGVLRFNPQAKALDTWYDLRPLGTEGQNFRGGPEAYSQYTLVLPFGIGYKWRLKSENIMVGVEIGHRMTFTDYIDDVSTVYWDFDADPDVGGIQPLQAPGLTELENNLAAQFADPSLGFFVDDEGNQVPLNSTSPGEQRGDPDDNDAYLFVQATVSYKIAKRPYRKRRIAPKRGKRVVF